MTIQVRHEVAGPTLVRLRKHPAGPYLSFSFLDWRDFIANAKAGQFDEACAVVVREYEGGVHLMSDRRQGEGPDLICSRSEWQDFMEGVVAGDFDREDFEPQEGEESEPESSDDVLILARLA